MDRERFGRALGKGVRMAARTAMEAADAATAPGPGDRTGSPSASRPTPPQVFTPRRTAAGVPPRTASPGSVATGRAAATAVARAAGPLRRASRALWHEVWGSFFALFALSFAGGAWHSRAAGAAETTAGAHRWIAFAGLALLFAYFAVSSFVRARRAT